MQQKYCDHGRSVGAVDDHPPNPLGPEFLTGQTAHVRISLSLFKRLDGFSIAQPKDLDVFPMIQSHVGHDGGEEGVWTSATRGKNDGFALEITDRANRLVSEQLLAADMTTRQDQDRVTRVDTDQKRASKLDHHLNVAGGECLSRDYIVSLGLLIVHLREALGL
jgi:hypothetical protein